MSAILAHLMLFSSAIIGYILIRILYRYKQYKCEKKFSTHEWIKDHSGYGSMACSRCGTSY